MKSTTITALLDQYQVLLLDAYGVLVSGRGPLPGATELIQYLELQQFPYFVLTNDASKLPETGSARYHRMGLPLPAERIITSGSLLTGYFRQNGLTGANVLTLGTTDSVAYVQRAGGVPVDFSAPAEAIDVIVVCDEAGYPFLEGLDRTLTVLYARMDAGLKTQLILPNPDLVYPVGGSDFGFAAGAIAMILEAAARLRDPKQALTFARLGKPFPAIFDAAKSRSGTDRMVMVGDQLQTDIKGAKAAGLAAALIEGGVTRADLSLLPQELHPDFLLKDLSLSNPSIKS